MLSMHLQIPLVLYVCKWNQLGFTISTFYKPLLLEKVIETVSEICESNNISNKLISQFCQNVHEFCKKSCQSDDQDCRYK